jgi:hypothetical protein
MFFFHQTVTVDGKLVGNSNPHKIDLQSLSTSVAFASDLDDVYDLRKRRAFHSPSLVII